VAGDRELTITPDELRVRGVINLGDPLPVSPCVRSKANGRLFLWHPSFARRPEAFENCDETGDVDPARWRGRGPVGHELGPPPSGIRERVGGAARAPYLDNVLDGLAQASGKAEPEIDPALIPPVPG
jgi:hypothetical protein